MDYLHESIINDAKFIIIAFVILAIIIGSCINSIRKRNHVIPDVLALVFVIAFSTFVFFDVVIPATLKTYDYAAGQFYSTDCIIEDQTSNNRTAWLIIESKRYMIPKRMVANSGAKIGDHVYIIYGKTSRFIIDIKVLEDINP
jgi:hypothetical protein